MGVWYITSNTIIMKIKITFSLIITALMLNLSSCCLLMPTARTSTIGVSVTPSNATIKHSSSGSVLGTGSCNLDFDCKDEKGTYWEITMSAPDYKTITERIYNTREDYSRHFTLRKLHHTKVTLNVEPSNASIYYKNSGDLAGIGSCEFDFTEEDSNTSYYEVVITAPYYNDQVVRVYKNDGVKKVSLTRKPIKTVIVTPGDADIEINNEKVAKGKYDIDFERTDKVLITLSRIGYETATYTLLKSDPRQTVTYEMDIDEAYENSEGGEAAAQYANKWVPIKTRKGMSEDEAWTRMISIIKAAEFELEKTDKSSSWIKTFPAVISYKASEVRTTLEIIPDYSTGEKQYKVRLYFEKRSKKPNESEEAGAERWTKYDRLMKVYKDLIPDLINSIGGM